MYGVSDMEELREKLIEVGDKLNIYQNGMEKLANFSVNLNKEIGNLNNSLQRAKQENKLREISKNLEELVEKLKQLKGNFALFSDDGSLLHQRLERIMRMTKVIREIDGRMVNLSKSFSNINSRDVDLFLQNSGRFINSAKTMKDELMNFSKKLENEENIKKEMIKKLARFENLRKQNEKLENEIKEKLLKMNGEEFMQFKEKIK